MHEEKIPRLIHVSDAYSNLPIGDNYGLSEQVHLGFPDSFMLGMYGESKTRAEMCVRRAAAKGMILKWYKKWNKNYTPETSR